MAQKAKPATPKDLIEYRLSMKVMPWRLELERKYKSLRNIASGVLDDLGLMPSQERVIDPTNERTPANQQTLWSPRENTEVRDIWEGQINYIQRELKSLVEKLALQVPDFQFERVSTDESLLLKLYFELRWGAVPVGCGAASEIEAAIWDMLTLGIGFPGIAIKGGIPCVHRYDPAQVLWDENSRNVREAEWVAVWETRRAAEWVELFGNDEVFAPYIEKNLPVELAFYYDMAGEEGTCAVYFTSQGALGTCLDYSVSPFCISLPVTAESEKKVCYIPVAPIVFMNQSGTATPAGLVQLLAPMQASSLRIIADLHRRLAIKPKEVVNLSMLSEESRVALQEDQDPERLYVGVAGASAKDVHSVTQPVGIDSTSLELLRIMNEGMTKMSNDETYSQGLGQDVKFAAEVGAIQQAGRQGMSYLTRVLSRGLQDLAQRYLWAAHRYDDDALIIHYNDLHLGFDGSDPVGAYLNPLARVIVREDDLVSLSRPDKITFAKDLIATLTQYAQALGPSAPIMIQRAVEELIQAYGFESIEAAMKSTDMDGVNGGMNAPGLPVPGGGQMQGPAMPGQQALQQAGGGLGLP